MKYRCEDCGEEFDDPRRYAGHRGGAHKELVDIRHGTEYGYVQHIRRGVLIGDDDPCGCRRAHADYQAKRRQEFAG
jgi:hypothetical protein